MIGIVVVSHSYALAQAAIELAAQLGGDQPPVIRNAAGLDECTLGTDAVRISDAVTEVAQVCDAVLVLVDLGSAILSSEMALELVDSAVAERTYISAAPLVEGLVSATVAASVGASLIEAEQQASEALSAKLAQLGREPHPVPSAASAAMPDVDALRFETVITAEHGLHARPAARLVSALAGLDATVAISNATSQRGPASARSLNQIAILGLRKGDRLVATASGPDAETAIGRLRQLAAEQFGEAETTRAKTSRRSVTVPASTQIVMGPVRVAASDFGPDEAASGDPATERARFDAAVATVTAKLSALEQSHNGDIFAAQQVMLADPDLVASINSRIDGGDGAIAAVTAVMGDLAERYTALDDPYQRERAQDVRSMRRLLWQALSGRRSEQTVARAAIIIMPELDASQAARLDPATTLGVITTHGGATGHGVIVAQSRGIPVLTGRSDADQIADGSPVAFDPSTGELWVCPDAEQRRTLEQLNRERAEWAATAERDARQPAITVSGRRVLIEANIASIDEARGAHDRGADGVGLVRTELLFSGDTAPTAQQQADTLIRIGRAMHGAAITVRTWDVGGDKHNSYFPSFTEPNPFLGERGLRAMRRAEDLFREQLRGILLAAAQTPVRVMFPMVTTPSELAWARSILDDERARLGSDALLPVGIMIEVPAAAIRAADFSVDFVSIGTNDLTQYITATDRSNSLVSELARPDSPAVLDLIAGTCRALSGIPIAVCGDMASDPSLVPALVAAGVTELSVRPPMVGLVKQAVRGA